jgi:hypothetical protein
VEAIAACTLGEMSHEMDRPFPPGPKGPEEANVPGPKLTLTPEQAKSVAELADRCSWVEVEDRGAGYREVRSFDAEGEQVDTRRIYPDGFYGTKGLPEES